MTNYSWIGYVYACQRYRFCPCFHDFPTGFLRNVLTDFSPWLCTTFSQNWFLYNLCRVNIILKVSWSSEVMQIQRSITTSKKSFHKFKRNNTEMKKDNCWYFRYIHDKNKCKYNKSLGNQVSPRWTYGRVFWLPQDKRAHFTLHRATNHF
jgi:hypothetical protein